MTNNIPSHDRAKELEDLIRIALSIQKPMWSNRAEYVLKLIQKSNLQSRIDELKHAKTHNMIGGPQMHRVERRITALEKELKELN